MAKYLDKIGLSYFWSLIKSIGNPNLTPFLSHDLADRGNNASGAYWFNGYAVVQALNSATQLEDGWARFQGSSDQMAIRINQSKLNIEAGATYTLLVELRNINTAPNGNMLLAINSTQTCQIYGDGEPHAYTEGEYRIAATGSSNPTQSMQLWLCDGNHATYDFEMRLSLYKGRYFGNYKPIEASAKNLFGDNLIAASDRQIVIGQYNEADSDENAIIIGNGDSEAGRNNVFTVGRDGSISMNGGLGQIYPVFDSSLGVYRIIQQANSPDTDDYEKHAQSASEVMQDSARRSIASQMLSASIIENGAYNRAVLGARCYRTSNGIYTRDIYAEAETLYLVDSANDDATSIPMSDAIASLKHPMGTWSGSGSTTATSSGWRLTHFNTAFAGADTVSDYITQSNGVITARRNVRIAVSGTMNWTDSVVGIRGFGLYYGGTAGQFNGTEFSVFQHFPNNVTTRKTVVFPPTVFNLAAGTTLTIGRYEASGAVYVDGTNYSRLTVEILGTY